MMNYNYIPTWQDPWNNRPGAFDPLDIGEALAHLLGEGMPLNQAGLLSSNQGFLSNMYEGTLRGYWDRAGSAGLNPFDIRTPSPLEFLHDFNSNGLTSALQSALSGRNLGNSTPAFSLRRIRF